MDNAQPLIVIRRINKTAAGHHGGAWKIAFADFALALMALFLVLWLIESTTNLEKQAISGYFSDPTSIGELGDGGTPYVLDLKGRPLNITNEGLNISLIRDNEDVVADSPEQYTDPELAELAMLRAEEGFAEIISTLETDVFSSGAFQELSQNIIIDVTPEGLKIQLIDKENRPMFRSGSAELMPYAEDLLWSMGNVFKTIPNRISIFGHTDSSPFGDSEEYTNWELSADRANAARRALAENGVASNQFAYIAGMASSQPYDLRNPLNPANRPIAILILNEFAESKLEAQATSEGITIVDPRAIPERRPLDIF